MSLAFEVILLDEAFHFIESQPRNVRNKILQNLRRSELSRDPKLFKKLRSEIWEFRSVVAGNQYRLLAFWDKADRSQTLVIATHGFIKKTKKTTSSEINKAIRIRNDYFRL